ncbi:MAG TPA: NAD(P)-dependent oxidoreductase [Enteractinococcus sp.]
MTNIGFIGLGNMGAPMCHRLLDAGHRVTVYDVVETKIWQAARRGATVAESAAAVAACVDVLFTSLPRTEHVVAVMREARAVKALQPGAIWVDLTTNRKELIQDLARETAPTVGVVDAPGTGAVDGARTGNLTLFVGGQSSHQERVWPLLQVLGTPISCGTLGTGNVVKLVTWFVAAAAIGEGFALGLSNGVELDVLWSAIKQSVGDSFVARHDAPSIFAGHYDPSFTLDLCTKDLGLIRELAQNVTAFLPMTTAAHEAFEGASGRYGASAPELSVAKAIEEDAGLSFRLPGDWIAPWDVAES